MKGLLADVNIEGYVDYLVTLIQAEPWFLFWQHLGIGYYHFAHFGLESTAPDSEVWELCQREQLVLITNNRNKDDENSLESTIRTRGTSTSLPVFTIASIPHLHVSRVYANRIIDKLLDALLRIDTLRGAGRIYLP